MRYALQGNLMAIQKLTVEGCQLEVSVSGQGLPLLLLNGLGGLIPAFDSLRQELADYTTITLNVPGDGKSHMPRWPMRLPRHAHFIAEVLKQLGYDQVDVFGVSWGGALAQEFTLRYPSMVRRLVLAATSAGPAMLVKPGGILDFFRKGGSAGPRKRDRSHYPIQSLLYFCLRNGMLTVNQRTYYHQLTALVGWTSLLRLVRLRQRTLILTGDLDPLVRQYNAHILHRAIHCAEIKVLEGEGHFFVVTSVHRTATLIREFLS